MLRLHPGHTTLKTPGAQKYVFEHTHQEFLMPASIWETLGLSNTSCFTKKPHIFKWLYQKGKKKKFISWAL